MNNYIIVGTQRSGSNFVCGTLRNLKEVGSPKEYFNPVHITTDHVNKYSKKNPISYAHLLMQNAKDKSVPFAMKIHYLQYFENFLKNKISIFETFKPVNIIFLRRINFVQQAISLWKAELTQSWTHNTKKQREAHYNFEEIKRRYFDLQIQDFTWAAILKKEKISFLNIYYEDMLGNEKNFFFNLLSFLGRSDLNDDLNYSNTKIQRNTQTIEWEYRFKIEYQKSNIFNNKILWNERVTYWGSKELVLEYFQNKKR